MWWRLIDGNIPIRDYKLNTLLVRSNTPAKNNLVHFLRTYYNFKITHWSDNTWQHNVLLCGHIVCCLVIDKLHSRCELLVRLMRRHPRGHCWLISVEICVWRLCGECRSRCGRQFSRLGGGPRHKVCNVDAIAMDVDMAIGIVVDTSRL